MDKRIFIIIITVLILAVVSGLVLYFSIVSNDGPLDQNTESGRGIFPFLDSIIRSDTPSEADTEDNIVVNDSQPTNNNLNTSLPRFRKLWSEPVAGATFNNSSNGSTTIRFVDRATGHVYETYPTLATINRLSNTTIPAIQEVIWASPDDLVVRYLREDSDIIETFSATIIPPIEQDLIATSTEEIVGELNGQFLPINIQQIIAREKSLFYILRQGSGVMGIKNSLNGLNAQEVFLSPIRDWVAQWVDDQTVALTTKASGGILGHLLFLNTKNGSLTPIISSIEGLTTHVDQNVALYSNHRGGVPQLYSYDIDNKINFSLPVSTFTEKCVVSNIDNTILFCGVPQNFGGQALPDEWYQGLVHFDDKLWKIDIKTLSTEVVINFESFNNEMFDIIDLQLDEKEENVIFINKTDNSLWLLQLVVPELPSALPDTEPEKEEEAKKQDSI